MDWDTFYFEYWVETDAYLRLGFEPTHEDYQEWLYDKADLALGE